MTSYPPSPEQQPTQHYSQQPTGPQLPYPPPQPGPNGQTPAPKPKRKKWPFVVGGAVVLAVIIGVASGTSGTKTTASSTGTAVTASAPTTSASARYQAPPAAATQAPAVATVEAPAGPATTAEDGTYEVGTDIAPGQYKTAGPDKSDIIPNCYYARLKNDSGEFSAIIANGNLQGPGSVTVKKGEYLQLMGGCTWTKK